MKIIKHKFSWEENESHEIFWKHQKGLEEQAKDEVHKIIMLLDLKKEENSILDVGCGIGYHMKEFGLLGYHATGIEVSDYSFENAKKNCEGIDVSIYKVLAKDMPWKDKFDLSIALRHTLGYMDKAELHEHLEKIRGALKPGGKFILTVPYTLEMGYQVLPVHKWSQDGEKYTLVDKYINSENVKVEKCVIIDTQNDIVEEFYEEQIYYSWKEIVDILSNAGFKNIKVLKNFDGEIAANGIEARIYMAEK